MLKKRMIIIKNDQRRYRKLGRKYKHLPGLALNSQHFSRCLSSHCSDHETSPLLQRATSTNLHRQNTLNDTSTCCLKCRSTQSHPLLLYFSLTRSTTYSSTRSEIGKFEALLSYEAYVLYIFMQLLIQYLGGENMLVSYLELKRRIKHPWPF